MKLLYLVLVIFLFTFLLLSHRSQTLNFFNPSGEIVGQVNLRSFGPQTVIVAKIDKIADADGYPVVIQSGSCQNLGPVLYQVATIFFQKASGTLLVSYPRLMLSLPISVVVYKNNYPLSEILFCTTLEKI